MRILALSLAGALDSISAAHAALPAPSLVQPLEMQTLANPRISPDGRRVSYEETRTNWDASEGG